MGVLQGKFRRAFGERVFEESEAFFKSAIGCRSVEDEETDFVPEITFILAADNADCALEFFAVDPEFAVEGHGRKALDEPIRRVIDVALAREELFAIPIGAN